MTISTPIESPLRFVTRNKKEYKKEYKEYTEYTKSSILENLYLQKIKNVLFCTRKSTIWSPCSLFLLASGRGNHNLDDVSTLLNLVANMSIGKTLSMLVLGGKII